MDTKRTTLIENIRELKGFAEDLAVAQKAYATAIAVAQEKVGQKLVVSLFESDAAYRAYRRVERRYVRNYKGETADAESVWESIVAGEAFPSFPYVWLPTEYGWWDIEDPTTRAWWVKETLLQAGWERDGDQWFPPSPSEEETEKED